MLNYQHRLGNSLTLRRDCIKDLGVRTNCKLHFYQQANFLSSRAMKLLGLIRTIKFPFPQKRAY
jgi:hypothetical protein